MSKKWLVVIGIVVGILALLLVGLQAGLMIGRAQSFVMMNRATGAMPYPGRFDRPDRFEGRGRFDPAPSARNTQLEVQLLDDDGDGIPDRGVVELPVGPGFNRGFEGRFNDRVAPGQRFGPGFDLGRSQFNRFPRAPFRILGGLACLAILAGLGVLGVALYRRGRSSSSSSPVAPTSPTPTTPEATGTSPDTLVDETSSEAQPDAVDVPEITEPERD